MLTTPAVTSFQKAEQKVIFTISFLIAADGTDPKASAGIPMAGSDNPNSSCSVQQESEVGETKQYHTLYIQLSVSVARGVARTEVMTPTCGCFR